MIFLRLSDGLGNQLFQYAYARCLQEKYKEIIWINIESYKDNGEREYSLSHFKLNPNVYVLDNIWGKLHYKYIEHVIDKERKERVKKQYTDIEDTNNKEMIAKKKGICLALPSPFKYYQFPMTKRKNKLAIGYFQSEKYFREIRDIIIKEFTLKEPLPENVKKLMKVMSKQNSVCVHIRRGDYLKIKWKELNICDENYYLQAMDVIAENVAEPVFYIFSNSETDLKWIEKNYHFKYPVQYVNMNNPDYVELKLMSACKHFVISNSTFSWWAQYLSSNQDKVVVAPDRWYKSSKYSDEYIYMDTWKRVKV
ncbi:MAG: alpha-1,2-fucosyltransferase [Lachnospiraceae bacterium]|nr:alpha-1,2-fucosyltransferase [Lachnospiraceae bacterium]